MATRRLQQRETPPGWQRDWVLPSVTMAALGTAAVLWQRLQALQGELTAYRRYAAQLTQPAFFDPLTGLPNRALFLDRLGHALARGEWQAEPVAVLFLDLDHFKRVNDQYGHAAGDEVLRLVGQRLLGCVRHSDTVARYGGDEFVILLEGSPCSEALAVAERVRNSLRSPVPLGGAPVCVSTSIGIALGRGGSRCADELLAAADRALYQAKAVGPAAIGWADAGQTNELALP